MKYVIACFIIFTLSCKTTNTPAGRTSVAQDSKKKSPETKVNKPVEVPKWKTPTQPPIQALEFPEGEAFRTSQPKESKPRPFGVPVPKKFRLKNKITTYHLPDATLPTVVASLVFDGGAETDPVGKEGRAEVCMDLLTEGTTNLNKIEFEEAKANLASSIGSSTTTDAHIISMRALSRNYDATMKLMEDTLSKPGLRKGDLSRIVNRRIQSIAQTKRNPVGAARRVTKVVLYGPQHPRGRVQTAQSLQSLTIDDCKAFLKSHVKPGGAKLFIAGDVTAKQVKSSFGALADWSGKLDRVGRIGKPKSMDGHVFVVDQPGAAQSAILAFHFGPKRKARDYVATQMMANVLGGGFSGRVNMNLREDKGYSYGARAGFSYNQSQGVFLGSTSVRTDASYQSVLEVLGEIEALKKKEKKITKEELTRVKNSEIRGLPGRFSSRNLILSQYQNLVYHSLPLNYYKGYAGLVRRVNRNRAQRATRHLKPKKLKLVIVGDLSAPMIKRVGDKDEPLIEDGKKVTLREALTSLAKERGWGPLVEVDADGNKLVK